MRRESAIRLVSLCLVCCVLIYATAVLTQDRIRQNQEQQELAVLNAVITQDYDNNPLHDYVDLDTTTHTGARTTLRIHRLNRAGVTYGMVIKPVTARGYNGAIELIVGLEIDGSIMGVNVLHHNETENIGDQIDQSNTDWLHVFTGMSVQNTPAEDWRIRPEGGRIDHLSGATVSSRAIVNALRHLTQYYHYNRQEFLAQSMPDAPRAISR